MKSSKGNKKDFDRYVQSELDDDYYLEPLKSDIISTKKFSTPSKSGPRICHCKDRSNCRHPDVSYYTDSKTIVYSKFEDHTPYHWQDDDDDLSEESEPAKPKAAIIRPKTDKFTDETMRTCISNLGTDAKNCYYGLQEFKIIKDQTILERFKDMYRTLKTINVLFLSVACAPGSDKIEAVYLWQMNEKCPYVEREENQQSIVVDVKSNLTNTRYFPSILLLAKITPETREEILEAKILGDNKLLIQSKITSELVYKIFNVTSFETSARVNPLQQNILANSLYTWKLKVNPSLSEVQVSVWKKYTLEELDQDTPTDEKKLQEGMYISATPDISLTLVEYSYHGWTILLDKRSSTFIIWKENAIDIFCFTEMMGTIQTFEVKNETICVLINTKGQVFTFDLSELPNKVVQATPHILPNFKENPLKIQLLNEKYNLRAVGLAYFWKGKFYCVNLMENEPATVLFDLKDEGLPEGFSSWGFMERGKEKVLFYVKNNVLNIYDLEKSRHQTHEILKQKSQDWQVYSESPNKVYVHTVGAGEVLVREIHVSDEDQDEIEIQYFDGESPIHYNNKNIVQIDTSFSRSKILLIRMKEPVYENDLNLMSFDGPLSYIPPNKELEEMPEKRERCPYHKLVDRMEIIQKRAGRYQYDEKFAEEAEQMQKDIQDLIAKRVNEKKEEQEKYDEHEATFWSKPKKDRKYISPPEEIDFKKYLDLYKEIKQVQKLIKAAKMRQSARPKNDVIS